jgi:hypothetical protein
MAKKRNPEETFTAFLGESADARQTSGSQAADTGQTDGRQTADKRQAPGTAPADVPGNLKRKNLRLPPEYWRELEAIARSQRRSISEIVREAVRRYLKG